MRFFNFLHKIFERDGLGDKTRLEPPEKVSIRTENDKGIVLEIDELNEEKSNNVPIDKASKEPDKEYIKANFGDLFAIPDNEWKNAFAQNKRDLGGFHPTVIKRKNKDNFTFQITPGTSSEQNNSCVYRTSLKSDRKTYFLLKLSMPITTEKLNEAKTGWSGLASFDDEQKKEFEQQIKWCHG